ncbi:MAG: hypothetical protein V4843_08800 [Pseudomonadota bacterium]
MRTIVWGVFAFLTVCWTAMVALSVQLVNWLLGAAGSGQATAAATSVGQWPVPAWAALWVDPAWLQALQAMWLDMVQWLGQVAPSSDGLMSWITPLLWTGWGLGMMCLLVPAIGLHWLIGRVQKPASLRSSAAT